MTIIKWGFKAGIACCLSVTAVALTFRGIALQEYNSDSLYADDKWNISSTYAVEDYMLTRKPVTVGLENDVVDESVVVVKTEATGGLKSQSKGLYNVVFFSEPFKGDRMLQKDGVTAVASDFPAGTKILIEGLGIRVVQESGMKVPAHTVYVFSKTQTGTLNKTVCVLQE